jgi:hypothetical protein
MQIFKNVATTVWEHMMGVETHWLFGWICNVAGRCLVHGWWSAKWTTDITEGAVNLDEIRATRCKGDDHHS